MYVYIYLCIMHLGGEKHCESELPCPRTHSNVPAQGLNPDRSKFKNRSHFSANYSVRSSNSHALSVIFDSKGTKRVALEEVTLILWRYSRCRLQDQGKLLDDLLGH